MLKTTGMHEVSAPSWGRLKLNNNSILELYFVIFISEFAYLIRTGLFKRYTKYKAGA